MVSFWPWKGGDTSPASFEKALSSLSDRITTATVKLDGLRKRARRFTVLWTLYSGFAYLISLVVLVLVVGWRQWGLIEYLALVGGPLIIYAVRLLLTSYYDYRTSSIQLQVDDLETQRSSTIEKLKAATKYNSTQELLKKYGGSPSPKEKARLQSDNTSREDSKHNTPRTNSTRTSFIPPPTANIPGRTSPNYQGTPQHEHQQRQQAQLMPSPSSSMTLSRDMQSPSSPSADFAPNAFTTPPQYASHNDGPRWYDRFMDVLLGEDESQASKRIALICKDCRLVNGQAPPGIKRIEDVGRWRCMGCGAVNGEETEVNRIVAQMKADHGSGSDSESKPSAQVSPARKIDTSAPSNVEEEEEEIEEDKKSDVMQYSSDEDQGHEEKARSSALNPEADTPRRRSARAKRSVVKD